MALAGKGIVTDSMNALGVDVYHGTGYVDWHATTCDNAAFAIVKATDGTTFFDPCAHANFAGARKAGLHTSMFHYYRCGQNPHTQAMWFLSVASRCGYSHVQDMPLAVDIEDRDGAASQGMEAVYSDFIIFLRVLEAASHRKTLIYADPNFIDVYLQGGDGLQGHPLWLATSPTWKGQMPEYLPRWTFRQTTRTGTIAGIAPGTADLNEFNGDEAALRAWGIPK